MNLNLFRTLLRNTVIVILLFIQGSVYPRYNEFNTLSERVILVSDYIASYKFKKQMAASDHSVMVDSIFKESLHVCDNDISEALLTATLATIPYKDVPVTFPIINEKAKAIIISMPDSVFRKKVDNLPSDVFFDSPGGSFGDKDKLSHFFGNAFLSYNVSLFNLSKFLSILVELFEESFKVEGSVSTRDLLIGNVGEVFGRTLSDYENKMPSEYMSLYKLFYIKFIY
jgi:hypothetical protein